MQGKPETRLQPRSDRSLSEITTRFPTAPWENLGAFSEGLPVMSRSGFELNAVLSSSPVDLKRLGDVVRKDPSLAANVLRLLSAKVEEHGDPYCGLDQCLILIGASCLRAMALTIPFLPSEECIFDRLQALWQHSILSAILSERIACECGYPNPELAYIGGLLHDLGEIPVLLKANSGSRLTHTAGWTSGTPEHCNMGARLATVWKFPATLIDVIEHHHHPDGARRDPLLVAIVAAADQYCRCCGVGIGADEDQIEEPFDLEKRFQELLPFPKPADRKVLLQGLQSEFLGWVADTPGTEWSSGQHRRRFVVPKDMKTIR